MIGVALALTGFAQTVHADAPPSLSDPDEEAARRHFDVGVDLYAQGHYPQAIAEFETARRIKPSAAFDYNIGRCHDHMEAWAAAADEYERYLAAAPNAPETAELKKRIVVLRARSHEPTAHTTVAPTPAPLPTPAAPAPRLDAAADNLPAPAFMEEPPAPIEKTSLTSRPLFWVGVVAAALVVVAGVSVSVALGSSRSDPAGTGAPLVLSRGM